MADKISIDYEKERICKNSIRYKKTTAGRGPVTIYVPNDMFDDPTKAPENMIVDFRFR